jgi:hypothetical protein
VAYRLDRRESVIEGLKQVVHDEFESAAAELKDGDAANRDEVIHEARNSK